MIVRDAQRQLVLIGLGGNVGDVTSTFLAALERLDRQEGIRVLQKSALYRTPPWGDENQDWFLNACAALETTLEPLQLLDVLKKTEQKLKREKTRRWGPRTIDLDILLFGNMELTSKRLTIPHPRMLERGFVLLPLNDIAAGMRINGEPVSHWLEMADLTGIEVARPVGTW